MATEEKHLKNVQTCPVPIARHGKEAIMGKKSTGEQLPEIPTNSAPAGKRRKKPGCLATIGIILIVLIVIAGVGTTINNHNKQVEYENQTFTWPTSGLATLLPEPATNKGKSSRAMTRP